MAIVACRCGNTKTNFVHLKHSDFPNGYDCEQCPKMDTPAPAQEPQMDSTPADDKPKKSPKSKKKEEPK